MNTYYEPSQRRFLPQLLGRVKILGAICLAFLAIADASGKSPGEVRIESSSLTATFDGNAKSAAVTTVPEGLAVDVTYNGLSTAPTGAGTYAVVATINDPNYEGSANGDLVIGKALVSITLGDLSQTYDGGAKTPSVTTTPEGLAVDVTYAGSADAPVNAGTYAVAAAINDPNYEGSSSETLTIGKATASVVLGDLAQAYDGSATTASATTTPEGLAVDLIYNGSADAPVNAGTYTVAATINDPNYEGSANGDLVIGKALANMTLGDLSQTYDGGAKTASVATTPEGLAVDVTYDGSADAPVNAGTYAVAAAINDPNYEGTASGDLVISKATASVVLGALAQTYDGTARVVSATTTPEGLNVDVTYASSAQAPTDAGTYAVLATISNANYEGSASDTLVIGKASATVTLGDLAQTYDGTTRSATATTTPDGLVVDVTYDGNVQAPANAGTYAVIATINDANHEGSASDVLTVDKATASVVLGDLAQTYDGSARTVSATTTPEGLVVDVTYDGSAQAPANAGTYAVAVTINDANYEGNASDTLTIGKATASVTLGDLSQTYDGSAKSASTATTPESLAVDLTYDGSSAAPSNAGTYPVVATINDANYAGSASGDLVIGKAAAQVVLGDLSQTYNGSAKVASATTTPEGLNVGLTYDGSSTAPSNAGTYPVVATIINANYQGSASDTLVIGKAMATVTLGDLSQTYDGSAKSASAATTPESLAVDLTYDGSSTAPASVGTYAVTARISDANYEGSASGDLVMSKATASVVLGALAQTYDGTARVVSATTTPEGLNVDLTYDGSTEAPTGAGSYDVVATVDEANYSGSARDTLVIGKATVLMTLADLAATYDGTAKTASVTTDPSGLDVSLTYDGSSAAPTNAGSYVVAASVNDPNYEGSASETLIIAKAAAEVVLGDLSQTYDGSAKVATAATTPAGLGVALSYNGADDAPVNAGTYEVTATIDDLNYRGTAGGSLTIGKAEARIVLGDLAQTYDGSAKSATAVTTPGDLDVAWTYDGSSTVPVNAGSYEVGVLVDDPNYVGSAAGTLVIGKAAAGIVLGDLTQTYDGSAKPATATTTPQGLNVVLTYNGEADAPVNAGTYTLAAAVNDPNHTGSADGTLVIGKGTQSITFAAIDDQDLGGAPLVLSGGSSSGLAPTYSVVSGPASLSGDALTLQGLGTVIVRASQAGDANWLAATPVDRSFRVVAGDFPQNYVWASGIGGTGYDTAYAVAPIPGGGAYLIGDFENSVTFGSSTFTVAGGSLSDLVVLKVDGQGGVLWARQYGGANSDFAKAVVALPSGGMVVGSEFTTSTAIGGVALNSAGSRDIALFKVNDDGTFAWAKSFGGTSSDSLHLIQPPKTRQC